jgi:hypothetical protein
MLNDQQVEAEHHLLSSTPIAHYVADNVDHNVRTLNGLNTFHGMGVILATVQKHDEFRQCHRVVCRLQAPVKAAEAIRNKCVPILSSNMLNGKGIADVELLAIRTLRRPLQLPAILNLTTVWHASGKISPGCHPRPNWAGYMQTVCDGEHSPVGTVEMLSIVDLNPSDNDCIYSTLQYVIDQAKLIGLQVPNITFDQPLYIKALDIAIKCNMQIVLRLGGFHMLMSFLGSIGHMMNGSGLEEVLALVFGPNTVNHILNGKAYARAVQGHFLVHAALTDILMDFLQCPQSDTPESVTVAVPNEVHAELAGSVSKRLISDIELLYEQSLLNKVSNNDCD